MIPCLLVSPDPAVCDIVKVGFDQMAAFEVDVVGDGWAVEMAQTKQYRVAVVDAQVPDGSDGLELLKQLRAASPATELLYIARSRSESRSLHRDKQALGLYGFLHVPVEPVEFFATLARLLERLGGVPADAAQSAA